MIKLDKNTIQYFKEKKSEKIKIFFYDAGCSGTKVDIIDNFEMNNKLCLIKNNNFDIYIENNKKEKFEDCSITRIVKADHSGKEKIRYIFKSNKIKERCGCGSSFNFDGKKKVKLDLSKLKDLKSNFKSGKNIK